MAILSSEEEKELLLRLREGDHDAFTTLYRAHHHPLYLYAYRLVEDEEQAADFVQEVFIYLWEKKDIVRITSIVSYLFQAVRHKFLNIKEHHKVRAAFAENFQHYLDTSSDQVSAIIEEKELFEQLNAALAKLPEKMAKIFALRQQNIPDSEIAMQLGISEKTVKNLMSQTLKKLQHTFKRFILFFSF